MFKLIEKTNLLIDVNVAFNIVNFNSKNIVTINLIFFSSLNFEKLLQLY